MSWPLTALATLALGLALATPALAGGWAATTVDGLPDEVRAGETYSIGYTVRAHGIRPVDVGATEIQITSPDGARTLSFRGVPDGGTGHYVAEVTFPSEGRWTWLVVQGFYAPHPLGKIEVAPAVGAVPAQPGSALAGAPSQQQPAASGLLLSALLLASAGGAILIGTRLGGLTAAAESGKLLAR